MTADRGRRRVCFILHLRPERVSEYRDEHTRVWPEMRQALSAAGWSNYSLFLGDDGTLVGYLECDDFEQALAAMDATEVNARWQAKMAPFFALDGQRPDEVMRPLIEIFHLA